MTALIENEVVITAAGYEQLARELELLRTDARAELAERLREARDDGDLADNPALYEILEEQAQLERRIALLEARLAEARVIAPATDGVASIGNVVCVRDLTSGETAEYELVGAIEADVGNGRVSISAPVGRALVGRRAGERVEVVTPGGTSLLEVLEVSAEMPQAA
jgi:transcription elongation factor GreA